MAKEMLDTIRRAESEAVNRQTMAQNSADTAISRAKADAQAAVESAIVDAKSRAAANEQQTHQQCAARSVQRSQAAQQECDKLIMTADKNRDRVVSMVIDSIAGR